MTAVRTENAVIELVPLRTGRYELRLFGPRRSFGPGDLESSSTVLDPAQVRKLIAHCSDRLAFEVLAPCVPPFSRLGRALALRQLRQLEGVRTGTDWPELARVEAPRRQSAGLESAPLSELIAHRDYSAIPWLAEACAPEIARRVAHEAAHPER